MTLHPNEPHYDDKRIKELVKEYVETGNKDLLGETYTLIKKVAQAVTCKYYRVRDPEELEELGHKLASDMVARLMKGSLGLEIGAWVMFIKAHARGYLPYKDQPFYRKNGSIDFNDEIFAGSVIDDSVQESYDYVDINTMLQNLVASFVKQTHQTAPFHDPVIKSILAQLAVSSIFTDFNISEIQDKRIGFIVGYLNGELATKLKESYGRD